MIHPLVVASMAVLLVNDHVLKERWPGPVTGKVSDIAGLVFFPLLLLSFVEIARALTGRSGLSSRTALVVCVAITGCVFAAAELIPIADHSLEAALGWPFGILGADAGGPRSLTPDPTDLLALPALVIAWRIGRPRSRRRAPSS